MPKLTSTDGDLSIAEQFLKQRKLKHLLVKKRADTLTSRPARMMTLGREPASAFSPSSSGPVGVADAAGRCEATPFGDRSRSCSHSWPIGSLGYSPSLIRKCPSHSRPPRPRVQRLSREAVQRTGTSGTNFRSAVLNPCGLIARSGDARFSPPGPAHNLRNRPGGGTQCFSQRSVEATLGGHLDR
jgi:hypothetical protein